MICDARSQATTYRGGPGPCAFKTGKPTVDVVGRRLHLCHVHRVHAQTRKIELWRNEPSSRFLLKLKP